MIGEARAACPGLRFVGKRRALDEAPGFIRTLLRSDARERERERDLQDH